ncbi:MAG: type II toxin-antitoxin system VapC family toxin [Gemmatimonadota bacterium]
MRFFDASAIVKRYVREHDSGRVRRQLAAGDVAVSRLSEVEVVSAFARLAREEALTGAQRDRATAAFVADLSAWTVIEISGDVTRTARDLLSRHALRSADALQLAAALVLQQTIGRPLTAFVAFDRRLRDAAVAELAPSFDPPRKRG